MQPKADAAGRKQATVWMPLAEYSWFVDAIRKNRKGMDIESAVDLAINEMPESFEIRSFLIEHRTEVKNMSITEYNEAETMQMIREEGREEGRMESAMSIAKKLIEAGRMSYDEIAASTGLDVEHLRTMSA